MKKSQSIQLGKTFDIFISHISIDVPNVKNIIHALNKQGYICWLVAIVAMSSLRDYLNCFSNKNIDFKKVCNG